MGVEADTAIIKRIGGLKTYLKGLGDKATPLQRDLMCTLQGGDDEDAIRHVSRHIFASHALPAGIAVFAGILRFADETWPDLRAMCQPLPAFAEASFDMIDL